MTNDQLSGMRLVKPLQERGPEPADKPDDSFLALVKDTLAALDVPEDTCKTAAPLIDAAHDARMEAEAARTVQARREAFGYAAMDRANQSVMQFVKRTTGQFVEINARQHAHLEMLGKFRHDVRELVKRTVERDLELVPVKELQQLLTADLPPVATTPVIAGIAPDARFHFGAFTEAGGDGRATIQRTFIGWSLIVQQPAIRSVLEPTFLDLDGTAKTQSQLHHEGLDLQHLS